MELSPITNVDEPRSEDLSDLVPSGGPEVLLSLDARSRSIAVGLRDSLEPIVRKVVGGGGRPAALSRGLDIDRTLAARVLRAIRADDTVQVLQEIPAPNGLRIFLDAAARVGV